MTEITICKCNLCDSLIEYTDDDLILLETDSDSDIVSLGITCPDCGCRQEVKKICMNS